MIRFRRVLQAAALLAFCSPFVPSALAAPLASGSFANDNSLFSYSFTTTASQNYSFATTSFASGGFVPVLTLFNQTGGNPLAFAENDATGGGDVLLNQLLGPGSYILLLTEDPNVFTSTLAAGPLFAGSPNATGDLCGVSGGKFLNVFDGCSQRTSNFAVTVNTSAATPEPGTLILLLGPAGLLGYVQRRRLMA